MSRPPSWAITQPYDSIGCWAGIQYQTYRSGGVHASIAQLRAKPKVSENNSATHVKVVLRTSGARWVRKQQHLRTRSAPGYHI